MQRARSATILTRFRASALSAAVLTGLTAVATSRAVAEESHPYIVEVSDVTAKVGEHAVMLATLRFRDGYTILEAYNNRVMQLSSFDNGVAFESKVVDAAVRDGALVFAVGLQPTKPGKHPINGVFRFGYIEGGDTMKMISV